MKLFKNHDTIALVVLFLVILITVLFRETIIGYQIKPEINVYHHGEYTDIDIQTPHILR